MQDPALHAVLLDCLGNAGDPSSLRTLVDHMTGDVAMVTGSGELSVRHAAVKAVARQKTVEVCVCVCVCVYHVLHCTKNLVKKRLTVVQGFRPKTEQNDFGKQGYHRKEHLKRSRMVQISAS